MADVKGEQATLRSELASLRELLVVQLRDLDKDVTRVEAKFDKRWDQLELAQLDARKDSRSLRNILIGVGVAAVLSPIGGIIVVLLTERAATP